MGGLRRRTRFLEVRRPHPDHAAERRRPQCRLDLRGRRQQRLPVQPHRRRHDDVRAGEEPVARRARRDDRQGALDPRQPARHRAARDQLLGEPRRQGSPPDLPDQQQPPGDRRRHRQVDPDLRQERHRRSARRRRPRSGARRPRAVGHARQDLREPAAPRLGARRRLPLGAGHAPRLRRRDRQDGVGVPHRAASGRGGLRDVAQGCLEVRRRRQYVGRDHGRPAPRHRVLPDRIADLRLLRRRPHRQQPLRELPDRPRRAHRQAGLALPGRAPRSLGLRPDGRAAARDREARRQVDRRGRARRQARLPVRVRSRHGQAALADRGAPDREEHGARRADLADAAVPDQAPRRSRGSR